MSDNEAIYAAVNEKYFANTELANYLNTVAQSMMASVNEQHPIPTQEDYEKAEQFIADLCNKSLLKSIILVSNLLINLMVLQHKFQLESEIKNIMEGGE